MRAVLENKFILLFGALYAVLACYLLWIDSAYLSLVSTGLLGIYFAIFYTEGSFLALAFLAPVSVNIEEWTDGAIGLFIPTEPLLLGLLVLLLMQHIKESRFEIYIWKHPIVIASLVYLTWTLITSITSEHPAASFKFFLAKLWFFIPLLYFGPSVFRKRERVRTFIWLLCLGMTIAILYTLVHHASYGFAEKEGHWVMWPFFKDHTIYGAAVAFVTPCIVGLFFSRKHSPLMQVILIGLILIVLIGLYFSYTRAAWVSVIASLCIWTVIKLRVKFSILVAGGLLVIGGLWTSWDQIQMELERNKYEHTTEDFGEKFRSATNVTTDASNLERLNRWSCAIEMFKERPILGFGPGTYAFEYARFQRPENLTIISTNFGDLGNAHSEYLGPMAEMGIIGLLSILFIVTAIFYKGVTLYYKWPEEDKEMRTLIMTMILALVTYFVHGTLNNYLDTDKASIPIWGFCAAFIALEYQLTNGKSKAQDSNS